MIWVYVTSVQPSGSEFTYHLGKLVQGPDKEVVAAAMAAENPGDIYFFADLVPPFELRLAGKTRL